MPQDVKLPGRIDGEQGLIDLAKVFGDEAVFDLILLCRTARSREADAGGAALTALAKKMVSDEMGHCDVDYDTARRKVAARLGYHDVGSRSNFYKVLEDRRPTERRPNARTRNAQQ